MKLKSLIAASLAAVSIFTVNAYAYAYSSLEVIEWTDTSGNISQYTIALDTTTGLKGVLNKSGTVVMDFVYYDIKELPGWNKFAVQKKNGKWTILNLSGTNYLKTTYDYIDTQYCDKGFVEVGNYGENEFKNNVGIISENMELIVPVEYQTYIYSDDDGLLLGKRVSENNYEYYKLKEDNSLEYVANVPGVLTVCAQEGMYYIQAYKSCSLYNSEDETYSTGYITTLGIADEDYNVIIEPIYEVSSFSFNNEIAIVKKGSTTYEEKTSGKIGNGKYGIIDKNGNEIVECIYDSITRTGSSYTFTLDSEKTTLTVNEILSNQNGTILIYINGTRLQSLNSPVIVDSSTMLPLRDIAEALGAEVTWDSISKTTVITKDDTVVSITLNSSTMLVNNKTVSLSVPAQIIDGSTYIPLRGLATALNCTVSWDSTNKIVTIRS